MKYVVKVGDADVDVELNGDIVTVNGVASVAHVNDVEGTPVRMVTVGHEVHRVVARRGATRGQFTLWLDGFRYDVEALDERSRAIRELSGAGKEASGPAPLIAPMPGMIVMVMVSAGQEVTAGQALLVLESMKMENQIKAPRAGTVEHIQVSAGERVEQNRPLLTLL